LDPPPHRRIAALIGAAARSLESLLNEVDPGLECWRGSDLYGAAPELQRFRPESLWVDLGLLGEEDLGALRLIGRLLPGTRRILIVRRGERKPSWVEVALEMGIEVVRIPAKARDLVPFCAPSRRSGSDSPERDLLAGLADHLNNPLAALSGRIQLLRLLQGEEAGPDLSDNLDLAERSARRMQTLLEKLTDLAGRIRPIPGKLRLEDLVRKAVETLEAPLGARVLSPEMTEEEKDPTLALDPDLAVKALCNLLRPALDLAAEDEPIRLVPRGTEEGRFRLDCLFPTPFPLPCRPAELLTPFRLDPLLRDPDLGLDLAVSRNLLRAQGGDLEVLAEGGLFQGLRVHLPLRS